MMQTVTGPATLGSESAFTSTPTFSFPSSVLTSNENHNDNTSTTHDSTNTRPFPSYPSTYNFQGLYTYPNLSYNHNHKPQPLIFRPRQGSGTSSISVNSEGGEIRFKFDSESRCATDGDSSSRATSFSSFQSTKTSDDRNGKNNNDAGVVCLEKGPKPVHYPITQVGSSSNGINLSAGGAQTRTMRGDGPPPAKSPKRSRAKSHCPSAFNPPNLQPNSNLESFQPPTRPRSSSSSSSPSGSIATGLPPFCYPTPDCHGSGVVDGAREFYMNDRVGVGLGEIENRWFGNTSQERSVSEEHRDNNVNRNLASSVQNSTMHPSALQLHSSLSPEYSHQIRSHSPVPYLNSFDAFQVNKASPFQLGSKFFTEYLAHHPQTSSIPRNIGFDRNSSTEITTVSPKDLIKDVDEVVEKRRKIELERLVAGVNWKKSLGGMFGDSPGQCIETVSSSSTSDLKGRGGKGNSTTNVKDKQERLSSSPARPGRHIFSKPPGNAVRWRESYSLPGAFDRKHRSKGRSKDGPSGQAPSTVAVGEDGTRLDEPSQQEEIERPQRQDRRNANRSDESMQSFSTSSSSFNSLHSIRTCTDINMDNTEDDPFSSSTQQDLRTMVVKVTDGGATSNGLETVSDLNPAGLSDSDRSSSYYPPTSLLSQGEGSSTPRAGTPCSGGRGKIIILPSHSPGGAAPKCTEEAYTERTFATAQAPASVTRKPPANKSFPRNNPLSKWFGDRLAKRVRRSSNSRLDVGANIVNNFNADDAPFRGGSKRQETYNLASFRNGNRNRAATRDGRVSYVGMDGDDESDDSVVDDGGPTNSKRAKKTYKVASSSQGQSHGGGSKAKARPRKASHGLIGGGVSEDNPTSQGVEDHVCNVVLSGKICGVRFKRSYDLDRHKATLHSSGSKADFQCAECNGKFSRRDALQRHCRLKGHSPRQ